MSSELIKKVSEALKNKNVLEKINECKTKEELYKLTSPFLTDVTEAEFYLAYDEMKDQNGEVVLSDNDLEGVAGGFLNIIIINL